MSEWQPIETAPKDQRILLFRAGRIVCGQWDDDCYAQKPKPYWRHDLEAIFGRTDARKVSPTHWQPLLAPTPAEALAITDAGRAALAKIREGGP